MFPLRTRRALSPKTLYSDSAPLVLNRTSLNCINALLVLNWRYIHCCLAYFSRDRWQWMILEVWNAVHIFQDKMVQQSEQDCFLLLHQIQLMKNNPTNNKISSFTHMIQFTRKDHTAFIIQRTTVEPLYNEVLGTMKITLLYQVFSLYQGKKKNI